MTAPAAVRSSAGRDAGRRRPQVARNSHDTRRTLLALLASALGVVPLCQLFTDRGWLIDVWLSMAVVIAPAAALRRRRAASAVQIWIGVLLLIPWLTVNFVGDHAVLGVLPFRGAWHDVGRLMTDLHSTTTDEAAPVHTTVAVRLAVCALLGLVAALVDLLAVVGRRGALAGVPLLIVFTVAGAVPRQSVSWIWFAPAAAGFLILLALDSSDDLQRWGHYVPRARRVGHRRAAGAISGQRIAVAAIALAVVLPVVIPAHPHNFVSDLFHIGGGRGSGDSGFGADRNVGLGTGGIDPFAALRGQLLRDKNVPLLSVQVSSPSGEVGGRNGVQPFYLRTNVLSTFAGDGWRPGGQQAQPEPVAQTQFPSSPGTQFQPKVVRYSADITVTGLRSNPPVFGSPTALTGVPNSTRWSAQDMLLVGSRIGGGQRIHEDVAQPHPSIADLRAATAPDPQLAGYLKLPRIAPYVRALTARITATKTNPYDRARALSDYFAAPANGFFYSLQTANGDSGDDLTDFLKQKVGYCQQYAAAMAVMLRLAGVPARVVLGYTHAVPNVSGAFVVSTFDAHSWVEAYFTGIGWVPFDTTPLTAISGGSASDLVWAPHGKVTEQPVDTVKGTPARPRPQVTQTAQAPAAATSHGSTRLGLWTAAGVGVLVLAVLLLVPAAARVRRRRHRLRRARHGDTDALWAELCDTATDLGYVWSAARTPRQVAVWLSGLVPASASGPSAAGSLRALTAAVERDRYAPRTTGARPADLVPDLGAVEADLRSRRSGRERMIATFWPASLGWAQVRWIGRWLPGRSGWRRR